MHQSQMFLEDEENFMSGTRLYADWIVMLLNIMNNNRYHKRINAQGSPETSVMKLSKSSLPILLNVGIRKSKKQKL